MPKRGTDEWYNAVYALMDDPFHDFSDPNHQANAKIRWKDTDFSREFFEEVFPPSQFKDAWKARRLDPDDIRMVIDPDSIRIENEAVLNGDKTVCS